MGNFIGRKYEISLIEKVLQQQSAAVMIYGKRKVGKTTLIKHTLESSVAPLVYYECLKAPITDNVSGFVSELVRLGILPLSIPFSSFLDVFKYLNSQNLKLNIVIDEYPYLKEFENPETVDSQFQSIVDNYVNNMHLFLSGSHIGMMKNLLQEKNALYGRFALVMQLRELNYLECAEFYSDKSAYDKIAFYSVFGGSPFVNSFIDPQKSLRDNIISVILNPMSPVFNYAEHLLVSDLSNSVNAQRIMYAISNGKKKYNDIENTLDLRTNGLLSKQLKSLLDLELVSKVYPINKSGDSKKVYYELYDNLLRFYYSFVFTNKSALTMLGETAFYDEYIDKSLVTFISHRFEEICRNYFSILAKSGKLKGVLDIGTYYYDDAKNHTNGEFDVALKRSDSYDIYEAKYYLSKLSEAELNNEADKIRKIKGLTIGKIGFISINGFENQNNDNYVYIAGGNLYFANN